MDFLGLQMPDLDLPYDSFAADALRMRSAKLRGALLKDQKKAGTASGEEKKRIGASKEEDRLRFANHFSKEEKQQVKDAAKLDSTEKKPVKEGEDKSQTAEAENAGAKLSSKQKKAMAEKEEEIKKKRGEEFDKTHPDDVLQKERNEVFLNTLRGWKNELKIIEKSKLGAKSGSIDKAVEALNLIMEFSKESFSLKLVGFREKSKKPAYLAKMTVINKTLASLDEALGEIGSSLKDVTAKENVAGMKTSLLVIPQRIPIEAKYSFEVGEHTSWGTVLEKSMGGYALTKEVIAHNTVNAPRLCNIKDVRGAIAEEWNAINEFSITLSDNFVMQLDNIRVLHDLDLTKEAAYKDLSFVLNEQKDTSGTGTFKNELTFKNVSYLSAEDLAEKQKKDETVSFLNEEQSKALKAFCEKHHFDQFKLDEKARAEMKDLSVGEFEFVYIDGGNVPKEAKEELITRFILLKIRNFRIEEFIKTEKGDGTTDEDIEKYFESVMKFIPSSVKKNKKSQYELNEVKERTAIAPEKAFVSLLEKIFKLGKAKRTVNTENKIIRVIRK